MEQVVLAVLVVQEVRAAKAAMPLPTTAAITAAQAAKAAQEVKVGQEESAAMVCWRRILQYMMAIYPLMAAAVVSAATPAKEAQEVKAAMAAQTTETLAKFKKAAMAAGSKD